MNSQSKSDFERIYKLFKEKEYLYKNKLSGFTVKEQDIQRNKQLEKELFEEIQKLTFSYEGKFKIPEILKSENSTKISEIDYLTSIIIHFDSFTFETLRKFTQDNKHLLLILEIWRMLYCALVPINFYYLDTSFDNKHESFGRSELTKKMLSYNKITNTNRQESLKVLKKIILGEYEKYQIKHKVSNPKIILNIWDYKDLKDELKELQEQIEIEHGMFPGEFRIELKTKIKHFIEKTEDGKFKLNCEELAKLQNFSESFSPREYCAPKSFYSEFRNIKTNTSLFIWYEIKKTIHTIFSTMNQWNSPIALIITITILLTKK